MGSPAGNRGEVEGDIARAGAAGGAAARPRRILMLHQNFPGQFGPLARSLAADGHAVVALGITPRAVEGVRVLRYNVPARRAGAGPEMLRDFDAKLQRGLACAEAMQRLSDSGFDPELVLAHPGWGDALFCRDVFPRARHLTFAEYYYEPEGGDFGFDPEFSRVGLAARQRLRIKNSALLHALVAADGGYAPTHWQHSRIPEPLRARYAVAFDGVDTDAARPDPKAWLQLKRDGLRLAAGDEVLTYVARNLEPYRGFHVFMRALPEILRRRPRAHVLIVGDDGVSYGAPPPGGGRWRDRLMAEVGAELPLERVHFLGRLAHADYLRVLQVSACHVYLTYPFVLSWSCVEAMAAGCLVVGSRTAPVEEVIGDGREGLLVDFFDRAGLADRVCEVLAQPRAFDALRTAARLRAVADYDLRRVCLPRLRQLVFGQMD